MSSPGWKTGYRSHTGRLRGLPGLQARAQGLRRAQDRHPAIGDVRGLGCMLAMEFVKPGEGDGRVPDAAVTKRVLAEALERRLIVLSAGSYANVTRIIPPLVTTADEVDRALAILDDSVRAAGA